MESGERARHGLVALTLAALAMLLAAFVYLRPGATSATAPAAAVTARVAATQPGRITFGDAEHGLVELTSTRPSAQGGVTRYWTADGGRSWRPAPLTARGSGAGFVSFIGPRRVLSEETGGQALSSDGGQTWHAMTDPRLGPGGLSSIPYFLDDENGWWLEQLGQRSVAGFPIGPQPAGLWRTQDGGRTWTDLEPAGIPTSGSKGMMTFGDQLRGALVVTPDPGASGPTLSILTTGDGGRSWRQSVSLRLPLPVGSESGAQLSVRGTRILVTMYESTIEAAPGTLLAPLVTTLVFTTASADFGQTWGEQRAGPVLRAPRQIRLPTLDTDGRLMMLDGRRLWASTDAGATWVARVATLPEGQQPTGTIMTTPNALFVYAQAQSSGPTSSASPTLSMLRSRDGGIHWEPVPLPPAASA